MQAELRGTMRTLFLSSAIALLCAACAHGTGLDDANTPLVTLGPPTERPGAVPLTGFMRLGASELADLQPVARLWRGPTHLHIVVRVPLPNARKPLSEARAHDGPVWEDDSIEVFLEPGHTHGGYFQFAGNAAGSRLEAHRRDLAWNAGWQFEARTGEGGWEGEFAIPFASLGTDAPTEGTVWGLNVCVNVRGGPGLTWAPVQQSYHEPERFGHLRFSESVSVGIRSVEGLLSGTGEVRLGGNGPGITAHGQLLRDGAPAGSVSAQDAVEGETVLPVRIPREGRFLVPGRYRLVVWALRSGDAVPVLRLAAERVVRPPVILKAQAFVSEGVLRAEAIVEPAGLDRERLRCRFTVAPAGGVPTLAREVAWSDPGPARVSFRKRELPSGEVDLAVSLLENGEALHTARKTLDRPLSPPWLGDRTGITDRVPAPWTPVRLTRRPAAGQRGAGPGSVTAHVWGRRYTFAGLLPESVVTRGASVLAGPIRLRVSRAGKEMAWRSPWVKVVRHAPAAAELWGGARAAGLRLGGKAHIEYDGMIRVDLELLPGRQTQADSVVLEVPIRAEHARYLYHFPGQWGRVANSGALPPGGWRHAFKPFVWLGDEDRGFAWFCESDRDWSPADPQGAITVGREGGRVVLRLHLVEGGVPVRRPLRYTFGFQATPVKQPEQDVWDYRIHHGGSYTLHTEPYRRSGRITYPAAGNVRTDRGTFEAWIQPLFDSDPTLPDAEKRKMGNRSIFTLSFPGNSNCGIYWNELHQGPVVWVREAGEVRFYAGASTPWKRGEWHHLAFTWGDAIRAYLDGALLFEGRYAGLITQPLEGAHIILGEQNAPFVLDEVRILDEPRVPTVPTGPLAADSHTLLLESFDSPLADGSTRPLKGLSGKATRGATLVAGRFGKGIQLAMPDRGNYTLLDRLADQGVRTVCFHEHWTPYQSHPYTTPDHEADLRALVKAVHSKRMSLLLYMSRQIADIAPEYELYSEDVLTLPRTFTYTRAPQQTDYGVCWRSHWREFCLKHLAQTMDRFGNDGWYLDGPEWPCPCTNRHHGCGYVKPDGSIGATYDIFATREFMRRLYVLTRERRPRGQLNIHNSTVMVIPTLGWGTSVWNGEQLGSVERGPEFLKLLPLDAFRTEMMGRQWGTPSEFLCYERPWTTHEALSFTLLHDVLVRPNGYDDQLEEVSAIWRAMDAFGRKQAEWIPYWRSSHIARPDSSLVKVSIYSRGRQGALLVISNLSHTARTVRVGIDRSRLRLGSSASARNAITGERVALSGGQLSLSLGSFDYALVLVH